MGVFATGNEAGGGQGGARLSGEGTELHFASPHLPFCLHSRSKLQHCIISIGKKKEGE